MFAALHLLDLPVAAALRDSPAEQRLPWGVLPIDREIDDRAVKLPLLCVNAAARRAGIQAGWPLNRALVRCPGLRVASRQPAMERLLLEELVTLADALTPDLEIASADTVILDLSHSPPAATREALARLTLRGVTLCHGWAATPDLARLAVLHEPARGRTLTPDDLSRLDVSLLRLLEGGEKLLPLLHAWGISRAGDFLSLPRQALIERLGAQAGCWQDLLLARTQRPLHLHRPPESFRQSLELEDSLDGVEPLLFVLKRQLNTLASRLAARHLAACSLELHLRLESGNAFLRTIRLPEPLTETAALIRPLQTLAEQLQFDSPIAAVTLDAEATFPASVQREWFQRQLPDPARWADTLARLEGLLGPGNTGVPVPPHGHQPERFTLRPAPGSVVEPPSPAAPSSSKTAPAAASAAYLPDSTLPLHRFRPPQPIAVAHEIMDHEEGQMPRPLALLSGPFAGEILDQRGPYGHSGHWWDPAAAWSRLEWDIRLPRQRLARLVHIPPDLWQLDGIYV